MKNLTFAGLVLLIVGGLSYLLFKDAVAEITKVLITGCIIGSSYALFRLKKQELS